MAVRIEEESRNGPNREKARARETNASVGLADVVGGQWPTPSSAGAIFADWTLGSMQPQRSAIVRLNVGGTLFATTETTLRGDGRRSFFHALLDDAMPSTRDESGAFFVDRDPALFRDVLSFLRTGALVVTPPITEEALRRELAFFGLAASELPQAVAEGDATVTLHVFGGATTSNFVKGVHVDVHGRLAPTARSALEATLGLYEHHPTNRFELPAMKVLWSGRLGRA